MPAMKAFIVNGVGAAICARHLLYERKEWLISLVENGKCLFISFCLFG